VSLEAFTEPLKSFYWEKRCQTRHLTVVIASVTFLPRLAQELFAASHATSSCLTDAIKRVLHHHLMCKDQPFFSDAAGSAVLFAIFRLFDAIRCWEILVNFNQAAIETGKSPLASLHFDLPSVVARC